MTKYFVALFAALAFSTVAIAAGAPTGPTKIANKQGEITFDHAKHSAAKCETCHETATGGKVKFDGKDAGHAVCLDCHKANKDKGAKVGCKDCHSGAKAS